MKDVILKVNRKPLTVWEVTILVAGTIGLALWLGGCATTPVVSTWPDGTKTTNTARASWF